MLLISRSWLQAALLALLLSLLAAAGPAQAQARGHGAGLGSSNGLGAGAGAAGGVGVGLPRPPSLPDTANPNATARARSVLEQVEAGTPPGLARQAEALASTGSSPAERVASRRDRINELVMAHPEVLTFDPRGNPIVRGEAVLYAPSDALLAAARKAGFRVAREHKLREFDVRIVVLAAPAGLDSAAALQRLRAIDPAAAQSFNPLYLPSGTLKPTRAPAAALAAAPAQPARIGRVGLIDGGIDLRHPALRNLRVLEHGCEQAVPSAHGTATASLLAGRDGAFRGATEPDRLYAADVYCGQPTGGALDAVLDALGWMAREQVPVINISLVGPANPLLERVVAQLNARGHLLVAAVGNDGPAAPPLYPAAYAGVVGVSAVDPRRRVLPEAGQGPQVTFVAPGADLAVAAAGGSGYVAARGTSFAAPLVAGLLAAQLPTPDAAAARRAVATLSRTAIDLGAPGRDNVFGHGLVGEPLRVPPSSVAAR